MGFVKDRAADGMNMLPDRMNLFGRYVTGLGNRRLQLDPSTERSIYAATEETPMTFAKPDEMHRSFLRQAGVDVGPDMMVPAGPMLGPGLPTSGPKMPYSIVGQEPDLAVTNTLGRFNAEVSPTEIRVRDTYDMQNEFEDPDLISGKFLPKKAINQLRSAFDPELEFNLITGDVRRRPIPGGVRKGYETRKWSTTNTPLTGVARSLLYALPFKPKPFEIDYKIPR